MARNLIHLVKLSHEDNTVVDNIGSTETDLVPNEEIESLDVINSFTNKEVEKHVNEYNKSLHDQAMDIDPNLKKEAVNQAIATKSVLISAIAILNDALNIGTHWYFRVLRNRAHVLMSADGGDS